MSRVIVIHWESTALRAIVLRTAVDRAHVEAVASISLDGDDAAVGRKLAAALERYSANRTPKIAAVSRQQLNWQHLSLPPCPDDDLPDLVRMQSDYSSSSEDLAGLDFLPLAGDAATPHRVWAISLATPQLARFRRILRCGTEH